MRRKRWISQLIQGLRDEDEEVREEAADRLGELGPRAVRALPSLVKATEDEDWGVRYSAARALGKIGIETDEVTAALEELGEDECYELRLVAAEALLALRVCPPEMLAEFFAELFDTYSWNHMGGREILLGLFETAFDGFPPLMLAVDYEPESIPVVVLEMLAEIGIPNAQLLETLMAEDFDLDSEGRCALARALGTVGEGSIEAARLLYEYAKCWAEYYPDDSDASSEAIFALGKVGTCMATPALVEILTEWGPDCQGTAAQALLQYQDCELGSFRPTPETTSMLIGALAGGHGGDEFPSAAEHVLRGTGTLDEQTLVEIRDAFWDLGSPDLDLGRFERLSSRSQQLAIPALSRLVYKCDYWVAAAAARAIGRLDPALAVSCLFNLGYNPSINRSEAYDIISEICARSSPEKILAEFRSRESPLRLISSPEYIVADFRSRESLLNLIRLCVCGDQSFRDAACRTLHEVLGGNLVPTLGRILEVDCDDRLRQVSVEILGDQGRAAAVFIPALIRMLEGRSDPGLRSTILEALARIGQPDDVILPLWIGLEDRNLRIRSSAMAALSSLGPLVGDAIHGIAAVARNCDEEPVLRLAALRFIQSNKPDAEAIVGQPLPSLIESLEARTATAAQPPRAARVG